MVKRFRPIRAAVGRRGGRVPIAGIDPGFEQAVQAQINSLLKEYIRWTRHIKAEGVVVLREALESTFNKARNIYTPRLTGVLRDSAYLETRRFRNNAVVEIGFAKGGSPAYAALQHERLDFYHEPPTRAKFLQSALEEDSSLIEAAIIKGYKIAGGVG